MARPMLFMENGKNLESFAKKYDSHKNVCSVSYKKITHLFWKLESYSSVVVIV